MAAEQPRLIPPDAFDQLPARRLAAVVERLQAARQRVRQGAPFALPLATFYLRSGSQLSGWVLATHTEHSQMLVLLQLTSPQPDVPPSVAYLALDAVEAIVVQQAEQHLALLSDGAVQAPPRGEAPARLAVSREWRQLCADLSTLVGVPIVGEIAWETLPSHPAARTNLATVIATLRAVLDDLCADALGRETIGTQIASIVLAHSPRSSARLVQQVLHLDLPLAEQPVPSYTELHRLVLDLLP